MPRLGKRYPPTVSIPPPGSFLAQSARRPASPSSRPPRHRSCKKRAPGRTTTPGRTTMTTQGLLGTFAGHLFLNGLKEHHLMTLASGVRPFTLPAGEFLARE